MKTKLLLLVSCVFYLVSLNAQVPQGFNYQAIARDGDGNTLQNADLQVMLYIQSSSTGGTVFWKELHNPVTTNDYGLFTLVIGSGARQPGSTVATFDLIDWKVSPKYLKTEIYYTGSWKNMGDATQLFSVPYAMTAQNLTSTSKLDIKGTTSDMEEALLEVKNKDAQTIFAVYNEGIRVWVSNGNKGSKGGFVIGGFNNDNFFDVSTEATGIINPSQNRILWYPVKNAFLSGRVLIEHPDSVGENSFASGYESKGKGLYSQALGYHAIARGDYSTAIGKNAVSNSTNSFAFGENALAKNNQTYAFGNGAKAYALGSFALGYNSKASGQDAFAMGSGTEATGLGSVAIGFIGRDSAGVATSNTRASNEYSVAIGSGAQANNKGSFSIGTATTANSDFGLAVGYKSLVSGFGSTAIGYNSLASGDRSLALGYSAEATKKGAIALNYGTANGEYSISMGFDNQATANGSISMGGRYFLRTPGNIQETYITRAHGVNSIAVGQGVIALGINSCIIGTGTNFMQPAFNTNLGQARADYSMCFGTNVVATGQYATAMGYNTEAQSFKSFVIGTYNVVSGSTGSWVGTEPLFIIGNGTSNADRNNAITVLKNGNVGIGTTTPEFLMDVKSGTLGTTINSSHSWYRLSGNSSNNDQLKVRHRRFITGNDWGSAEIRIQKTVDVTDMAYVSFKADYLEMGLGSSAYLTLKNGNFGIGNTDPGYKLVVNGTAWCSSGAWTGSDIRWKKDIADLSNILSDVLKLQPVSYQLRTEEFPGMGFERGDQVGLIAQQVEELFPALVKTDKEGYKAVAYDKLSAVLVGAIKEQQQQIESQQKQIDQLSDIIVEMRSEIASLRSQ